MGWTKGYCGMVVILGIKIEVEKLIGWIFMVIFNRSRREWWSRTAKVATAVCHACFLFWMQSDDDEEGWEGRNTLVCHSEIEAGWSWSFSESIRSLCMCGKTYESRINLCEWMKAFQLETGWLMCGMMRTMRRKFWDGDEEKPWYSTSV